MTYQQLWKPLWMFERQRWSQGQSDDFFFIGVVCHITPWQSDQHMLVCLGRRQCHYPSCQSTDLNVLLQRFFSTPVNRTVMEVIDVFQCPAFSCCELNSLYYIRPCLNLDILSQMPRTTGYWNHKNSGHWYSHRRGQSTFKPQVRPWNALHIPLLTGQ